MSVRVAALYDVHGNLPALEAVLDEVAEAGVDRIVVGGDFASGPLGPETIERLRSFGERAVFIRGNADRELVDRYDGTARAEHAAEASLRYSAERLSREQRDFLARLAGTAVLDVDGLGPTLFCHGSPRSDEEILTAATPDPRLRDALAGVDERIVVCGHTHIQFDRELEGVRVVNAGSVGMPYEGEPGAYWALLGPHIELRRTAYAVERAGEVIRATAYPDAEELIDWLYRDMPDPAEVTAYFEGLATERAR